jgi:DNA-binding transcriptional MerR regulator
MSELARRSGVPAPTIKHYIREGLLPQPSLRTSRNMAYYDPALVPRIRAIKEAQRAQFLPLCVIREALPAASPNASLDDALLAIEHALKARSTDERRSRAQLVASGMPEAELDFFVGIGAVSPVLEGEEQLFAGDDLELLKTLGAARRAGLDPSMLPHTIIGAYVKAVRELVRVELDLFEKGILPRAGRELGPLVESATILSERLIVLLRRKLLLPTLRELGATATPKTDRRRGRGARAAAAARTGTASERSPRRSAR